jgi:hypothetical protein
MGPQTLLEKETDIALLSLPVTVSHAIPSIHGGQGAFTDVFRGGRAHYDPAL